MNDGLAVDRDFLGPHSWKNGGAYVEVLLKNPSPGIVDAANRQALPQLPAGKGVRSAVIDLAKSQMVIPYAPTLGDPVFANGVGIYRSH